MWLEYAMEDDVRIMSDAQSNCTAIVAHSTAAIAVIAAVAIAVITGKKGLWCSGPGSSAIGAIFFIDGSYLFY